MDNPLDIDTPNIRRWYDAHESKARATGNWGNNQTCVPADADAWKSACENRFSPAKQAFRWGKYQAAKCGDMECSVNSVRRPRVHPVADGVNPFGTNAADRGCLILEAKSSAAEDEQKSLYGTRPETDDMKLLRKRLKKGGKGIWKKAAEAGEEIGEEYREDSNIWDLLGVLTGGSDALDPGELEDAVDSAWADDRGEESSLWGTVRTTQISALMFYENACCDPDVPYQNYVVIVERRFMVRYFQSIITPSGSVIQSIFANTPTWKP